MAPGRFQLSHKTLITLLEQGGSAVKSERSIESAVNGVKLVCLAIGQPENGVCWVTASAIAPDIASLAKIQVPTSEDTVAGCVALSGDDLLHDLESLSKPHTVMVEWQAHGSRHMPSGKVTVTATSDKGRKTLTWDYDAYDPANIPVNVPSLSHKLAEFDLAEFKRCVDSVGFAAAAADAQGLYDGILVRRVDGNVQMVATDCSQMAIVRPSCKLYDEQWPGPLLLPAGTLNKIIRLLDKRATVCLAVGDVDQVWLSSSPADGTWTEIRLTMPTVGVRDQYPLAKVDKLGGIACGATMLVDRLEMVQMAKAAQARHSTACCWEVHTGATEVSVSYAGAAKPALVGCEAVVGVLAAPMYLSSLSLLKIAERMGGEQIALGFHPDGTWVRLQDPTDPSLFYTCWKRKPDLN